MNKWIKKNEISHAHAVRLQALLDLANKEKDKLTESEKEKIAAFENEHDKYLEEHKSE